MSSLNGLDDDVMPLEERFRKVSEKFRNISTTLLLVWSFQTLHRAFGFPEPRHKFKRIDSSMCLVVPNSFRMKNKDTC